MACTRAFCTDNVLPNGKAQCLSYVPPPHGTLEGLIVALGWVLAFIGFCMICICCMCLCACSHKGSKDELGGESCKLAIAKALGESGDETVRNLTLAKAVVEAGEEAACKVKVALEEALRQSKGDAEDTLAQEKCTAP